jgi:hypothetical protein
MFLGKVVDVPYSDFILFIAFANIEIEILEWIKIAQNSLLDLIPGYIYLRRQLKLMMIRVGNFLGLNLFGGGLRIKYYDTKQSV